METTEKQVALWVLEQRVRSLELLLGVRPPTDAEMERQEVERRRQLQGLAEQK